MTLPHTFRISRTINALRWALLGIVFCASWLVGSANAQEFFSPAFIQTQYQRYAPAMAVVFYSLEITNPATGEVTRRDGRAPGLLVSESGLVITHGHMQVENMEPFNIRVQVGREGNEKEYPAKLLKKPDDINLCFVQIQASEGEKFPHAVFQPGATLELGEPVLILTVLGETLDYTPSVMIRRVGAILDKPRTTYCLDEPLGLGAVAGPAINRRGQLVGVVGFDLSPQEGGELYVRSGHPLVYQSDLFRAYIDNPPSESQPRDARQAAWLGIINQPLTDDLAEYWSLPKNGGIVVSSIVPGSPASQSGLQRGDVIVEFNGIPIKARQNREMLAFTKLVRETGPGKTVPITVLRKGQPVHLEITLGERPKAARDAEEYEDTIFGLTVREITTDLRMRVNLSEDVQGVIVSRVRNGSAAQIAGMRPGVIIMSVGGLPVKNLTEYEDAVTRIARQKPPEVSVFCRVGARTGFFRIRPRWEADSTETERQ